MGISNDDMEKKAAAFRESLMDSIPDELDEELFRKLQDNINETLEKYSSEKSDDDEVPAEFDYDLIMDEMSDVEIPEDLEKRLQEINERYLENEEAKRKFEAHIRRTNRMRSLAAVFAVVVFISGTILLKAPQAEAFRLKLYDTVFSPTEEDVGIKFQDTIYNDMPVIEDEELKAKVNEIIERDGYILYPSVLPEGYELTEVLFDKKVRLKFVNEDKTIIFKYYYISDVLNYTYSDIEGSDNIEYLVNGQDAVIREDEFRKELRWKCDNIEERLIFEESKYSDELAINIAENVKEYINVW